MVNVKGCNPLNERGLAAPVRVRSGAVPILGTTATSPSMAVGRGAHETTPARAGGANRGHFVSVVLSYFRLLLQCQEFVSPRPTRYNLPALICELSTIRRTT